MDEYTVVISGIEHTMLLDPEDAERMGLKKTEKPNKARTAPANKATGAENKA